MTVFCAFFIIFFCAFPSLFLLAKVIILSYPNLWGLLHNVPQYSILLLYCVGVTNLRCWGTEFLPNATVTPICNIFQVFLDKRESCN